MDRNLKIRLTLKQSNNLNLKIFIIFIVFSYMIISIGNSELFTYLYTDAKTSVIMNVNNIYKLTIGLFAILNYYALSFAIKSREDDIKTLAKLGINKYGLFKALFESMIVDLIIAIVIGLGIGIFLSELVDLLSILLLDLEIGSHRLNIDIRAIGLTILFLLLFITGSLIITLILNVRKYPVDKPRYEYGFMVEVILLLSFVYYISSKALFSNKMIYFLILAELLFLLFLNKFRQRSEDISFKKALFIEFINQGKTMLIFITLSLTIALTNLYWASNELEYNISNLDQRPHFTVFEDADLIKEIRESSSGSQIFSDIYPVYISENNQIEDKSFKNEISNIVDFENNYPVSGNKIMNYSTYKKIFASGALEIEDRETIFLYSNGLDRSNYKLVNEYISKNNLHVRINDLDFKVVAVDRSDIIFANNQVLQTNIYVVSDDIFDRLNGLREAKAYNFIVSDDYLSKYGKNQALENIRNDFFARNIKFESLVWMMKNSYNTILSRIFLVTYLSLILIIMSGLFLAINILIFLNEKDNDFKILSLLGYSDKTLLSIKKSFIKRAYSLFYCLSLINYIFYLYTFDLIGSNFISNEIKLLNVLKVLFVPLIGLGVLFACRKVIFDKRVNYE